MFTKTTKPLSAIALLLIAMMITIGGSKLPFKFYNHLHMSKWVASKLASFLFVGLILTACGTDSADLSALSSGATNVQPKSLYSIWAFTSDHNQTAASFDCSTAEDDPLSQCNLYDFHIGLGVYCDAVITMTGSNSSGDTEVVSTQDTGGPCDTALKGLTWTYTNDGTNLILQPVSASNTYTLQ